MTEMSQWLSGNGEKRWRDWCRFLRIPETGGCVHYFDHGIGALGVDIYQKPSSRMFEMYVVDSSWLYLNKGARLFSNQKSSICLAQAVYLDFWGFWGSKISWWINLVFYYKWDKMTPNPKQLWNELNQAPASCLQVPANGFRARRNLQAQSPAWSCCYRKLWVLMGMRAFIF